MLQAELKSAAILLDSASLVAGNVAEGNNDEFNYHLKTLRKQTGPPPMFPIGKNAGTNANADACADIDADVAAPLSVDDSVPPSLPPPEHCAPVRGRSVSMASRAQQYLEQQEAFRMMPTVDGQRHAEESFSNSSSKNTFDRKRPSSFAPVPWEPGEYEICASSTPTCATSDQDNFYVTASAPVVREIADETVKQRREWNAVFAENEELKKMLKDEKVAQNDAVSKEVMQAMRSMEEVQQRKYKEWEVTNSNLRARLAATEDIEKQRMLDEKIYKLEQQLADEEKEHEKDKRKLHDSEAQAHLMNAHYEQETTALNSKIESLNSSLESVKSNAAARESDDVRSMMKQLEDSQKEMFQSWQSETNALKKKLHEEEERSALSKAENKKGTSATFSSSRYFTNIFKRQEAKGARSNVERRNAGGSSIIVSSSPTRATVSSNMCLVIKDMEKAEKRQNEEWKELQARQNALSLNFLKTNDEVARKQVLDTMRSLGTTQQIMYQKWEATNASLRLQLEDARRREAELVNEIDKVGKHNISQFSKIKMVSLYRALHVFEVVQ